MLCDAFTRKVQAVSDYGVIRWCLTAGRIGMNRIRGFKFSYKQKNKKKMLEKYLNISGENIIVFSIDKIRIDTHRCNYFISFYYE